MPLKTQHDDVPTLNLTSMIDVLFLLIIFFMVATRFEEFERNIDVTVPEVVEAGMTSAPQRPIIVSVFHDGHVELDGLTVSLDELTVRLTDARHRHGNPTVVIRGDAACPFQHVAGALAACRMANVSELGITVRLAGVADSSSPR